MVHCPPWWRLSTQRLKTFDQYFVQDTTFNVEYNELNPREVMFGVRAVNDSDILKKQVSGKKSWADSCAIYPNCTIRRMMHCSMLQLPVVSASLLSNLLLQSWPISAEGNRLIA